MELRVYWKLSIILTLKLGKVEVPFSKIWIAGQRLLQGESHNSR